MNDRIWELFRQAHHPHPKHGGDDMFFPEEFAELIVRECAEALVELEGGEYAALLEQALLQHFEIK